MDNNNLFNSIDVNWISLFTFIFSINQLLNHLPMKYHYNP